MSKTTIETTLHYYRFDLSKPGERDAYNDLKKKLYKLGLSRFASICHDHSRWYKEVIKPLDGCVIPLETTCLFDNQWNTASVATSDKGVRVFDWAEPIYPNRDIREGYWLEPTSEMLDVRTNTLKCRHCGHHEPKSNGLTFCNACLNSEYLKESDLYLTRLKAINDRSQCEPMTDAELSERLPLWVEAQTVATEGRRLGYFARERAHVLEKADKVLNPPASIVNNATTERDGMLWLLDRMIRTDNVIYYTHTGRFGFGWRQPLTLAEKSALLDVLVEFPFDYDINAVSGMVQA